MRGTGGPRDPLLLLLHLHPDDDRGEVRLDVTVPDARTDVLDALQTRAVR
ncbi:hypothetical protein ACFQV2_20580 [Actinokineospora soli]|uniref:MmyB-like transcription regulator ligand binding domain-containing protein n=1 Tax=Actinokineospora soli TaxID=1048753 RepID=A0ABW2TQS3_9PSEU